MSDILSLKDVHAFYGKKIHALKGVSLEVGSGEIVCIVGNNGAGKTTMLKAISGMLAPDEGDIRFQGEAIAGLPAYIIARRGLSHVPEGRHVFPA